MNHIATPDPRLRPLPLYAQIKETLRSRILDGTYGEHHRLPSEHELMGAFGVSRITVRQALGDLEKESLIFRIPGKGAFVAKPRPFQEVARLQGFGEAMSRLGLSTRNRVVGLTTVAADATVAERLQLPAGTPVTEIRRVRLVEREPVSLDVSYVPAHLGERLAREDLAGRDIFLILENDYGIALGHADLAIEATAAGPDLADFLGLPAGAPILRVERLTWSAAGRPLDFEYLHYRGDSFRYQLRAERG